MIDRMAELDALIDWSTERRRKGGRPKLQLDADIEALPIHRVLKLERQRLRDGLCIDCSKPRAAGQTCYCIVCTVKRREWIRKRQGSKRRNLNAKSYQSEAKWATTTELTVKSATSA